MFKTENLEQALALALTLSPLEKVRLVEQVMAKLEDELKEKTAKTSLYGLWSNIEIDTTIDESRQEIWGEFPREDIG